MSISVLAVAAHPDDIEIMMGGALLLLKQRGCEIHYMNLSDGDCGSLTNSRRKTGRIRTQEAINACNLLGGIFHRSLTHDMEIFYEDLFIRKLTAVVREVQPDMIFTHSLDDYMFDHINTAKLIVSAAFARGAPNYVSIPNRRAITKNVAIYHAVPYGCRNMMRQNVKPDFYIDISKVIEKKKVLLSSHLSQKEWLQATQGMDSYVTEMENMCRTLGTMSKKFELAEAFSLHLHLGYAPVNYNPLLELLAHV